MNDVITKIRAIFLSTAYNVLTFFEIFFLKGVAYFQRRKRIKLVFNPKLSTWHIVHNFLVTAITKGKAGYIAQHLVGAKLQLRFPDIEISNESTYITDRQTDRPGDFLVGHTAFHITVAPMPPVFEKCRHNITQGYRPFLLVPDSKLIGARQNADFICQQQIAVESIESFVSQNIDEIGVFNKDNLVNNIKELVAIYNKRVNEVETDKSLMIELPSNLK